MRFSLGRWMACACVAVLATPADGDSDVVAIETAMGRAALQDRLSEAGCYSGAIDGKAGQALTQAVAACPSQEPQLRIETGMHVARIGRISTDSGCHIAATGSNDKTVRIWSLPDGRLLHTLRVPIDPDNGGKIYAVAVSPNGRWIAASGYDANKAAGKGNGIYIFDVSSGVVVRRLGTFPLQVLDLVFSPDGLWLAATSAAGVGIKIFNTSTWRYVEDTFYGGDVYGGAFGPGDRFYAVALDAKIHGYGPAPDFRRLSIMRTRGGRLPTSVVVDPKEGMVAVAYADTSKIDVFDRKLSYRFQADTSDMGGNLGSVAWAQNGAVMVAGGRYAMIFEGGWKFPLVAFDRTGRRLGAAVPAATNSITDVHSCGDGFIVAAADPAFGLVGSNGRNVFWHQTVAADLRQSRGEAFTISGDGQQVRFALGYDAPKPVLFDLSAMTLSDSPAAVAGFKPAILDGLPSRLRGEENDEVHAAAMRPDLDGYVLGTELYLTAKSLGGAKIWQQPGPGAIWGTNISSDGSLVVVAYGDGTIRWHRWSDGRELLALFVNRKTEAWVAWTPSGYYAASPGGEDLIGWQVNRGWDQAADFFPASRFRYRFNRPDIVRLVLLTHDEAVAVESANAMAKRKESPKSLIAQLPPVIRIVDLTDSAHVTSPDVKIDYTWRSPTGQAVDRIVVLVDGRAVKDIGLPIHTAIQDTEVAGTTLVTLRNQASEIGLIAWSGDKASQMASVKLVWDGAPVATSTNRKLYALVVGISDYAAADMTLNFAAKDARDFGATLERQKGSYYSDVQTRIVTDRAVTRSSIIEGLKWLNDKAVKPDDVAVLFLAGHGMTDAKQTYWFLPSDATSDNFDISGVSQEELRRMLEGLPGKVLWFLDTCHAGGATKRPPVDMNVLVNTVTSDESGGIVVFASSKGRQVSVERAEWGNGAFTKALVEGIEQGKAELFGKDLVTTSSLDSFVENRVQDLTNGAQNPVMERPAEVPDFTIARATGNLSSKKENP